MTRAALTLPEFAGAVPWLHLDRLPARQEEFAFGLLSDRTGLARPGVFERAIEVTNLVHPDFAIQVGDAIEGHTTDSDELARQWAEFDAITSDLEVPLFRVPGNHDVSNELMRGEWLRRHGALHYHFVYSDVLFLVLDTQDPPEIMVERIHQVMRPAPEAMHELLDDLKSLKATDPVAYGAKLQPMLESMLDWEGTQPAALSDEQVEWAEQIITENADVRWTVLCMHMPAWQGDGHRGLDRIRRALGDRPYTAFAGHVHNYRHTRIDGRDHIRLGPTGGGWVISGEEGNFDHITLVTMTSAGPRIANLALDGILGPEGGTFNPARRQQELLPS